MYDYDLARFDEVFEHVFDVVSERIGENVACDSIDLILNAVLVIAFGQTEGMT